MSYFRKQYIVCKYTDLEQSFLVLESEDAYNLAVKAVWILHLSPVVICKQFLMVWLLYFNVDYAFMFLCNRACIILNEILIDIDMYTDFYFQMVLDSISFSANLISFKSSFSTKNIGVFLLMFESLTKR